MKAKSAQYQWFAAYLFYPGELDLMLKELVAPFIREYFPDENTDASYFFIRYWENGSHIRLRINVELSLQEGMAKALEKRAKEFFLQYPATGELSTSHTTTLSAGYGIQFSVYEPEIARYGNQQSLPWAELHFFKSSSFILDWICTKKPGASALLVALQLQLILLLATGWEIARLIAVCHFFIDGWLPRLYISGEDEAVQKIFWLKEFEISFNRTKEIILPASKDFWGHVTTGTATTKVQDLLKANILVLQNYQQADFKETKYTEIITSLIHMNNNRLGISNHEEAYGMYCTLQCLDFIAHS